MLKINNNLLILLFNNFINLNRYNYLYLINIEYIMTKYRTKKGSYMKTVNYSEARQNLTSVMNDAIDDRIPVLITRQNGIPCVLLSLDEYQSLEETAHLLRSPANARHLLDSIDELNSGNTVIKKIDDI